jgi:DNA adenine methylase
MHRSAIRYHGGKHRLAPWIISHFPAHRVYTEVYGGAASVLLRKAPAAAEVYNDIDGEIVNFFRVLRNPMQARELKRLLRLTPYAREEHELSALPDGDPIEQARRTLIRANMSFGSTGVARATGFRIYTGTGRNGTPLDDWISLPDLLPLLTERLRLVHIENRPALDVLRRHDAEDALHYVDPPYVLVTRTTHVQEWHQGYKHEMSDDEHRALATVLHALKGSVVLSGYQCPLYAELYPDWRQVTRKTIADSARPRLECLWLNPQACRHQLTMEVA